MPKKFFASLVRIGLSGAGAQVITILTLPFLTRLYDPDDFGVWGLIQSAAVLMATISTGRYELAIVLPKNDSRAINILVLGLILALIVTVVFAIIMSAVIYWDLMVFSNSLAWFALPPLIFLGATTQLAYAWCTRTGSFIVYGIAQFSLALLSAIIPAGLSNYRDDAFGLTAGILLASAICNFAMWWWLANGFVRLNLLSHVNLARLFQVASFYRVYPLYMTSYSLVGAARDRAVYFLIGAYSGVSDVGLYSIAQRLSNAPNSLISSALRPVFFRYSASAGKDEIGLLIGNVMGWLVILVIPGTVYFLCYPDYLIGLIFGQKWTEASSYVVILTIASFPLLFGNWMDRFLDVLGKQRVAFFMEVAFSVLAVSIMSTVFWVGGGAKLAITSQALVMGLYYSTWILIVFRLADIPLKLLFNVVRSIGALAILSASVIWSGHYLYDMLGATIFFIIIWLVAIFFKKYLYKC